MINEHRFLITLPYVEHVYWIEQHGPNRFLNKRQLSFGVHDPVARCCCSFLEPHFINNEHYKTKIPNKSFMSSSHKYLVLTLLKS